MSHVFVSFLLTTFQLQKCFLFEKLFDNFFLKIEFSLEVRFFFLRCCSFWCLDGMTLTMNYHFFFLTLYQP